MGYCGDEDNGQTSAWYVFSAMGFYLVCPGSNQYVIGAPLFRSVKLQLENGEKVHIESKDNSKDNRYVSEIRLNGKKYDKSFFTHEELMNGATIEYSMSPEPNIKRGTNIKAFPYSFSNERKGE